jgi:hypothetical protein
MACGSLNILGRLMSITFSAGLVDFCFSHRVTLRIKGSGTCKLTGNAGGGLDYECTRDYTLPAAAPAK